MNPEHAHPVILLVEDCKFQRKALMHQLNRLGYDNLLEAQNGEDALAICQQYSIDILVCDLLMPGMDGMELLRHLSQRGFSGDIILSSALAPELITAVSRMSRAYGLKVLGMLVKPAPLSQIRGLLKHWLPDASCNTMKSLPAITIEQLAMALDQGEIVPWYQPKVSLITNEWLGVEALARWKHPLYGIIAPDIFIPLAEESGLINRLTEAIIEQSLEDTMLWKTRGYFINLSINVSSLCLVNDLFCDFLIDMCAQDNIRPELITLEVTESTFIKNLGRSLEALARLRMYGFGISIDDFGTGYSSMQHLSMLPLTEIKLDRSFIQRCRDELICLSIIESILMIANKRGLNSVAEGVEDLETFILLAQMGCKESQGYYSGKPMPSCKLIEWHSNWLVNQPSMA